MSSADSCSICLENVAFGLKMSTNCHHEFHQDCIEAWLLTKQTCALCRQIVSWIELFEKSEGAESWRFLHKLELESFEERLRWRGSDDDDSSASSVEDEQEPIGCAFCGERFASNEPPHITCSTCRNSMCHEACLPLEQREAARTNWRCSTCVLALSVVDLSTETRPADGVDHPFM